MTVLTVRHVTTYRYKQPVGFGEHRIMFRPRDSNDQRLLTAEITVSPNAEIRWMHDVFGNGVTLASFRDEAAELRFETNIALDHTPEMVPRFRTEERVNLFAKASTSGAGWCGSM